MRVYISGPITGVKNYMDNFAEAEKKLRITGHVPFNPARVCAGLPRDAMDRSGYMRVSKAVLELCEAITMLEGWQESKGAKQEYEYALVHDMEFITL